MIVSKITNQNFKQDKREGLLGKGWDAQPKNKEKSFEQYLLEAFQGSVVHKKSVSQASKAANISPLMQANISRIIKS